MAPPSRPYALGAAPRASTASSASANGDRAAHPVRSRSSATRRANVVTELGAQGICISAGSACHRGQAQPRLPPRWSLDKKTAAGVLRVSFAPRDDRKQDIDALVSALHRRTATRASPCCKFDASTASLRFIMFSYLRQPKGFYQASFSAGTAGHRAEFDHHVARLSRYVHGGTSRQRSDVRRHGGECAQSSSSSSSSSACKAAQACSSANTGAAATAKASTASWASALCIAGGVSDAVCRSFCARSSRAGCSAAHHRQSDISSRAGRRRTCASSASPTFSTRFPPSTSACSAASKIRASA